MKFHLIFNINIFAKYLHDRELTFSRESWKGFIEAMARVSGNGFYAAATLQTKEGRIPGSDRNTYAGGWTDLELLSGLTYEFGVRNGYLVVDWNSHRPGATNFLKVWLLHSLGSVIKVEFDCNRASYEGGSKQRTEVVGSRGQRLIPRSAADLLSRIWPKGKTRNQPRNFYVWFLQWLLLLTIWKWRRGAYQDRIEALTQMRE